jgi:predicted flavoprotein YhiN
VVVEEDRGRLILESGDSRELLSVLLKASKNNNTEHRLDHEVLKIEKENELFNIDTNK